MIRIHSTKLTLLAASVAVGILSGTLRAQDDGIGTREVREAENALEQAEDRLERAEAAVEDREEALEDAIAEAAADRRSAELADIESDDWAALADEHDNLRTFVEALRLTGLGDTLASGTAYTVFAPTDHAFDEHDVDLLDQDRRDELIALLRAHIVADDVDAERARSLGRALTVDGGAVELAVDDGRLTVNDVEVLDTDLRMGNVRLHLIDEVLESVADTDVALGLFDED